MKIPSLKLLRLLWAGLAVSLLLCGLLLFRPASPSEVSGTILFCLFLLSFPCGWLGLAITLSLSDQFGTADQSRLHLGVIGSVFCALGYFLWFVVVPFIFRLRRSRRDGQQPSDVPHQTWGERCDQPSLHSRAGA